jgi:hypothetical protein
LALEGRGHLQSSLPASLKTSASLKTQSGTGGSGAGTKSVCKFVSGTRPIAFGYPNGPLNRTSTGILKKPTVIDRAWEN